MTFVEQHRTAPRRRGQIKENDPTFSIRPVPIDLTSIATGNTAARQDAANKALHADPSGKLRRFKRLVASSTFTTNIDFEKVLAFDDADGVIDGRSYHVRGAGGRRAQGLAAFASAQGAYFARREAFEDLWEHGRRFVYGAVNAGDMGAEDFGPICLVLPYPERQGFAGLGVFPADTVQRYTDAAGTVDEALAVSEATAWSDRADLATIERGHDVQMTAEADWPLVLCCKQGYLEVVLAGELPLRALAEARLRTELRKRLDEMRARWLVKETLTNVEQNEAEAYDALQKWRRLLGIEINHIV